MKNRGLVFVVVFTAVAVLGALPAASQTAQSQSSEWTVPRTPDGHPNLKGVWANNNITPLERPTELSDRAFLTGEELGRLKANANQFSALTQMTRRSGIKCFWLRSPTRRSSHPRTVEQATTISFGLSSVTSTTARHLSSTRRMEEFLRSRLRRSTPRANDPPIARPTLPMALRIVASVNVA